MPITRLQRANEASASALLKTLTAQNWKPIKIEDFNYVIDIFTSSELSSKFKEAVWELFKVNMESLYKSTDVFPWNPSTKRLELFHPCSRFIVIYLEEGDANSLVAFTMFRFESEDDAEGQPQDVAYCYEVQVHPEYQGKGLGATLVANLVKLANAWKMKKAMLTVFSENHRAIQFYKRQQFIEDEISPDDSKYLIMSKRT